MHTTNEVAKKLFIEGLEEHLEVLEQLWVTTKGDPVRPHVCIVHFSEDCACGNTRWPVEHVVGLLRAKLGYPEYA